MPEAKYKNSEDNMKKEKLKCPCGYIYDPEKGCLQNKIPKGTEFKDLPEDWICPYCGYEKQYFNKKK